MKIPRRPPSWDELVAHISDRDELSRIVLAGRPVDHKGRYLHWDDMRNRMPPDHLDHEKWWLATTVARRAVARELPLRASDGRPFRFTNVDHVQETSKPSGSSRSRRPARSSCSGRCRTWPSASATSRASSGGGPR